jgi:proline iminopeptidase
MNQDKFTHEELYLDVGEGHQIYVQDWGDAEAKVPIIFLHGGPGSGCDDKHKRRFDPATERVIFHDQRGAGKSLPTASVEANTTEHLIDDINKIVDRFKLDKFILLGGSWGSTLALAYALKHPSKVKALVIDGVFTASPAEEDWLDKGGWRQFYPDIWDEYVASVPKSHAANPTAYHFDKALRGSPEEVKRASYEYIKMESALLKLDDRHIPDHYDKFEPGGALIEIHYLANNCFLPANYILDNAHKLTMPIYIIQGRYDMVCPPETAYKLSQAAPKAELVWTINGHLRQHEASNVQRLLLKKALGA